MGHRAYVLLLSALIVAGCSAREDDGSTNPSLAEPSGPPSAPVPPPPPPPPPPPTIDGPDDIQPVAGGDEPGEPASQQVVPPEAPPGIRPVPPPATNRQVAIRLSTGIALPQTTPAGTVMSFSVDYRFVRGGPDPSVPYVWVIEREGGPAGKLQVSLAAEGTLQTLAGGWRSRDGPFRCHIEDRQGNRLCDSILLQ